VDEQDGLACAGLEHPDREARIGKREAAVGGGDAELGEEHALGVLEDVPGIALRCPAPLRVAMRGHVGGGAHGA
jgi:hypothetical protein